MVKRATVALAVLATILTAAGCDSGGSKKSNSSSTAARTTTFSADNPVDHLSKFKASATYHYEIPPLTGSRIALTGSYFNIVGTADATLYSPNSQTGSPNTAGWIGELAWIPFNRGNLSAWPWFNMRVGLQYTAYTKFDGSTTNIDGAGRKASDNNTLYSYVWTAF